MSFITVDNINCINAELSNYCNAACPMCARYDVNLKLVPDKTNNAYTTLDIFEDKIGIPIISRLQEFKSCGTYGDGATNPQCLEIFEFVRRHNSTAFLILNSNGGTRSKEFWYELGKLGNSSVIFGIDGLEDTNHLYRRNVKWHKLMENVQAFIQGGGRAVWQFLVFKHNQHQIQECKKLSEELGFVGFYTQYSGRWRDYINGVYRDITQLQVDDYVLEKPMDQPSLITLPGSNIQLDKGIKIDATFETGTINCQSCTDTNKEIYIMANGWVSPCCYVGDLHDHKHIIQDWDKVNINTASLQEILEGSFFRELENGIANTPGSNRLITCWTTCGVHN